MINVYVVSGFLGAGKTTFIQKLLSEKKFEKAMLLENEFGEIGVDSAFFDKSLKVKEINNGCICCSLQGDFKDALEDIEDMGVSDLIIEPSGVGKLSEIIDVIKEDPDFRIVCHICIVDVKTAIKYHNNFKEYFDDQVKSANAIILSHLDVAEKEKVEKVINIINELNPEVTITNKPVNDYSIDELLDLIVAGGEILPEIEEHHHHHHDDDEECCCHHHHHHDDDNDEECCCHHHHDEEDEECCHHHHGEEDECCCHEHEHHHHHDDETFKNIAIRPEYVFEKAEIESILSDIPEDIIRIKGYVNGKEGTLYFNYVLNESNVYYGDKRDDSLVVFIGTEIDGKAMKELFHE